MEHDLLVNTLHGLFSEGLIFAHRFGRPEECIELSPEQIENALNEKRNMKEHYYGLTERGGAHWEAFSSPDWENYIDASYGLQDEADIWSGELICMTKKHLEAYFRSLRYYNYDVDENSIRWDIMKPWKATYWKQLPSGHRVRFGYREKESKEDSTIPDPIDQLWYDLLWCEWR